MERSFPDPAVMPIDDAWSIAEGTYEDTPIVIRFRANLAAIAGHPAFPHRVTVTWTAEDTDESGLPEDDELERMGEFEDRLFAAFESERNAIAVAVLTHGPTREWTFYAADVAETERRLNQAFADEEPYPIELSATADPEWDEYVGILAGFAERA